MLEPCFPTYLTALSCISLVNLIFASSRREPNIKRKKSPILHINYNTDKKEVYIHTKLITTPRCSIPAIVHLPGSNVSYLNISKSKFYIFNYTGSPQPQMRNMPMCACSSLFIRKMLLRRYHVSSMGCTQAKFPCPRISVASVIVTHTITLRL